MSEHYHRIWKVVGLIPEGCVASYGQVADLAGLPGRARLVSRALKQAPEHLDLPWQRVLNSQGRIAIPAGEPSHALQLSLLRSEGVTFRGKRVDLTQHAWSPSLDVLMFALDF